MMSFKFVIAGPGRVRAGRVVIKFMLLFLSLNGASCSAKSPYVPHEGDILFQTSRSSQSMAIQLATHSPWSHVGLVYFKQGRAFVLEAVQPVRLTALPDWIARGEQRHFVARRLEDSAELLQPDVIRKMRRIGRGFLGNDYDLYFGWSDRRMYCSELVWKIYMRGAGIELGSLQKLKSFDLTAPPVRAKLEQRYGDKVPLDEPVISPAAIFKSDRLMTVYRQ